MTTMRTIRGMNRRARPVRTVRGARSAGAGRTVSTKRKNKIQVKKKTPRTRKPEGMSLEAWQVALRREFGREQNFVLKNLGDQPIFS